MKRETKAIALALFLFLYAIYLFSYSGWLHIIDEISLFCVTENLAKREAFDTNQIVWSQWALSPAARLGSFGLGGDVFSKKGLGPSLLAVPLYWLGMLLPWVGNLQVAILLNPLLTAATALLLFLWTVRLGYGKGTGLTLALIFGLGTMAWPYAKSFFGEPLSALALLLAIYYLFPPATTKGLKPPLLAGFFLGLAATTIALNLALAPFFLLKKQPSEERGKGLLAFLLPLGLWCLVIGLYNLARFGNLLETGYHFAQGEGFSTPLGLGLYGLLFSPYKGLFLYAPILFISLLSAPLFLRRHKGEGLFIIAVSLVYLYFFSRWWMWWGGFAWGPRFLVPLLPFWVLPLAPMVEKALNQRSLWPRLGLSFWGLLSTGIQVLAISTNYVTWEAKLRQEFSPPEVPPVPHGPPWMSLPSLSPILGQFRLLVRWNSDLAWLRAEATDWPALGASLLFLLLAGLYLLVVLRWGERSRTRVLGFLSPAVMVLVTGFALSRYYHHPLDGDPNPGYLASLAHIEAHHRPGDAILTITPYHYQIPMNRYKGHLPIYGFSLDEPPLEEEAIPLLNTIFSRHPRLWLVTAGIPPAHPPNGIEKWLAQRAYKASDRWLDDFRLSLYATPSQAKEFQEVTYRFGSAIELVGWYLEEGLHNQVLRVSFLWRANASPQGDYVVFVHLVDDRGQIVAQRDAKPQDGYRATSTWTKGQQIEDHYGLLIPENIPAGEYSLLIGLYDEATGARLEVRGDGDRALGDSLTLTKVRPP